VSRAADVSESSSCRGGSWCEPWLGVWRGRDALPRVRRPLHPLFPFSALFTFYRRAMPDARERIPIAPHAQPRLAPGHGRAHPYDGNVPWRIARVPTFIRLNNLID